MRALVYHSSHDVKVDSMPDPILQEADDVILKVTATAICGSDLHLYRGKALRQCIAAVRCGGIVSVPGVYAGFIHGFLFGDVFEKGVTFKTGQTHVQKYMPELLEFIEAGKLSPEIIISHRLSLEQAAEGYRLFDKKEDNCRKVVLTPGKP